MFCGIDVILKYYLKMMITLFFLKTNKSAKIYIKTYCWINNHKKKTKILY